MGKESLNLVEITELNLNSKHRKLMGRWTDTLAMMGPNNLANFALGILL